MGSEASGPREMMAAELQKLHAPLVMLNALSRCLTDDPDELEIRQSLTALNWRAKLLEQKLAALTCPTRQLLPAVRPGALLENTLVRGTS